MQTCYPRDIQEKDIFNFSWFITLLCDNNCWYCNVKRSSSFCIKKTKDNIIAKLNNFNNLFEVNILGGEPLTYPYLIETINQLNEIPNCQEIKLLTNFKKNIDWNSLKEIKKLVVWITWHAQYVEEDEMLRRFLDFEKHNINYGIRFLYSNIKQLEKFETIKEKIPKITARPIYQISSNQLIDNENEVFLYNGVEYTYSELQKKNLTSFVGWKCKNVKKILCIDTSGIISYMCPIGHVEDLNDIKEFDSICLNSQCLCNMLFLLKKWKE